MSGSQLGWGHKLGGMQSPDMGGRLKYANLFHGGLPWYDTAFSHRQIVLTDPDYVPSDITDMPLRAILTERRSGSVVTNAASDGSDVRVVDAQGNLMDYEVEDIFPSNQSWGAWVSVWFRVPTLSSSVPQAFQIYWGNSGATAQDNPGSLWGAAEYEGVYHFGGESGVLTDSSPNNNTLTETGAVEFGGDLHGTDPIVPGAFYDASDDQLDIGSPANLDFDQEMTLMVTYQSLVFDQFQRMISRWDSGLRNSWNIAYDTGAGVNDGLYEINTSGGSSLLTVDVPRYHSVFHNWYDGAEHRAYNHGVQRASTAHSGTIELHKNDNVSIGANPDGGFSCRGIMDECWIRSQAVSPDRIKVEGHVLRQDANPLLDYLPVETQ